MLLFERKTFRDCYVEELAKLREFNQCHTPAGSSSGGKFCSGGSSGKPQVLGVGAKAAKAATTRKTPQIDKSGKLVFRDDAPSYDGSELGRTAGTGGHFPSYHHAVRAAQSRANRTGLDVAIRKASKYDTPGYNISYASVNDSDYARAEIVKPEGRQSQQERVHGTRATSVPRFGGDREDAGFEDPGDEHAAPAGFTPVRSKTPRVTVTKTTYRDQPGYTIRSKAGGAFGTKIFVKDEATARKIAAAVKRGDRKEIDRLVRG